MQKNNNDAAQLLRLLAFLNSDDVLIDFLENEKDELIADLHNTVSDRSRLYDALTELTRFSLVDRQNEDLLKVVYSR